VTGQVLFRFWVDGEEYRIFTYGKVKGFEDKEVRVANYYPQIWSGLLREVRELEDQAQDKKPPHNMSQELEISAQPQA
jgi:hypothetical protein